MQEKARVVVCLPSYNEEGNLPALIDDLAAAMPGALILVVDDGSADGTARVAKEAAAKHRVVLESHHGNKGLAAAVRTAFDTALGLVRDDGYVILMDADGTHRPEQMNDLLARAERGSRSGGRRTLFGGTRVAGVAWYRKVLSAGARFLTTVIFGNLVARDVSCGYRLYRAALIRRAKEAYGTRLIVSEGFSVNVELLVKLVRLGARVDQIPLNLRYDLKQGASKIRIVRTVMQYLKLFAHLAVTRPRRGVGADT
ncbi:MAG: glycosyltransferase [Deltaproteobacteria bacterium]|nr:glycosyltransferase [Deltaproteobacteria bacterium]